MIFLLTNTVYIHVILNTPVCLYKHVPTFSLNGNLDGWCQAISAETLCKHQMYLKNSNKTRDLFMKKLLSYTTMNTSKVAGVPQVRS